MFQNKYIKYFYLTIFFILFLIVVFNSIYTLLEKRHKLLTQFGFTVDHTHFKRKYNDTDTVSLRQVPPILFKDLKLTGNEDEIGLWSAPFDWPVNGIHSILLPNEKVLTFGSYSIIDKENKDIRQNKKLVLSDGRTIERDGGDIQWHLHDVLAGSDFDIWDPAKGVLDDDNAHKTIIKPINLDAFCSIVRVIDENEVFLLGGNVEITKDKNNQADYQRNSTIFNISKQEFFDGHKLEYPRWYGSIVRTPDDNFVMLGGEDVYPKGDKLASHIPEIFQKKSDGSYAWKTLNNAASEKFFGRENNAYFYPRAFLTSKGDIFGISYNRMWVMPREDNYDSVRAVGEIELAEDPGIKQNSIIDEAIDHSNHKLENTKLKILSMSSPVGYRNNSAMIDKDKVVILGGIQDGDNFSASNKVKLVDFSNIEDIKISNLKSMNYARQNSNTTLLPTGELFVNGGASTIDDYSYSVLSPEIYNFQTNQWSIMEQQHFRRNYHAASLLLPDGSILITGGDVWNAEIFYPPYLFTKDKNGEITLAERPKIKKIKRIINQSDRDGFRISVENNQNIKKISLLSTGSKTHGQASEAKIVFLDFEVSDNSEIKVKIPKNKSFIQNGTYMIFVINNRDVPSRGMVITLK